MILYHGSKSGIQGDIQPKSRERCDFGSGFYMGDKPDQPKGLIASRETSMFYVFDYDMTNLSVKEFGNTYSEKLDWALFIAYNRKPELFINYNTLRTRYESYNELYDVIIGHIADDSMMPTLTGFFDGTTSDKEMIACLEHVNLGKQYVLKTEKACNKDRFKTLEKRKLSKEEIKKATNQNVYRQNTMGDVLKHYSRQYRRDTTVKFIDDIMEEWNG